MGNTLDNVLARWTNCTPQVWHCLLSNPLALVAHSLRVQHVISLVNNENFDLGDIELASLANIEHSAGCADNNTSLDGLPLDEGALDGGHYLELFDGLADVLDDALDLSSQFAAGREDECLRLLRRREVDSREEGCDEGGSLACTGLRLGDHVARRVRKQERKGSLLNLRRLEEAHLGETLTDLVWAVQYMLLVSIDELSMVHACYHDWGYSQPKFIEARYRSKRVVSVLVQVAELDLNLVARLLEVGLGRVSRGRINTHFLGRSSHREPV